MAYEFRHILKSEDPFAVQVFDKETQQQFNGTLVYSLNSSGKSNKRDTIYILSENFTAAPNILDSIEKLEFILNNSADRTADGKALTNKIIESPNDYSGLSVVAYRRGAIPVAVISDNVSPKANVPTDTKFKLVVFPRRRFIPEGRNNKPNWRASGKTDTIISFQRHLPTLMRQYFENSAKILDSLISAHKLSDSIRSAKEVERILSESVNGKLKTLIPKKEAFLLGLNYPKNTSEYLISSYFKDHADYLLSSKIIRYTMLYFLNEFYSMFPISVVKDYADRADRVRSEFGTILGQSWADSFKESPNLEYLKTLKKSYSDGDEIPAPDERLAPWLQSLHNFVQFLRNIRKLYPESEAHIKAGIFLSYHFEDDFSEKVVSKILKYTSEPINGDLVHCVRAKGKGGEHLQSYVTSGIWYPDTVFTVFPHEYKNLNWITIEAEYAHDLEKIHRSISPRNPNINKYVQKIRNCTEPPIITNKPRNPDDRESLASWLLSDRIRAEHPIPKEDRIDDLPTSISTMIQECVSLSKTKRAKEIMRGLTSSLGYTNSRTLFDVIDILGDYREKRKKIEEALVKKFPNIYETRSLAEKRFKSMWNSVKERPILIDSGEVPILEVSPKGEYYSSLSKIMKNWTSDNQTKPNRDWKQELTLV